MRLLWLTVLLIGVAAKTDFSHEHVVPLTAGNFVEKTSDGKLWFIKFYAPWCGHCKKLAPTWGDLGSYFKDNDDVVVAHIDCTAHKDVCQKAEVKGYPTLKIYFNGQVHKGYKGPRDEESLKKFANDAFTELFSETTS